MGTVPAIALMISPRLIRVTTRLALILIFHDRLYIAAAFGPSSR